MEEFEITTAVGLIAAMRKRAVSRHFEHSTSTRARWGLKTLIRAVGHADFNIVVRRNLFSIATRCKAGNHCAACESPNKTTSVEAPGSPKLHSWTRASA